MSGITLYAVIAAAVVLALYFVWDKRRKKGPKQKKGGERQIYKAIIYDNLRAEQYFQDFTAEELKEIIGYNEGDLGPQLNTWEGWAYMLTKDEEKTDELEEDGSAKKVARYRPVSTVREIDTSSSELYQRIEQVRNSVPYAFDMRGEKGLMESYGHVFWWVAVMAFIMFLFVSGGS